MRIGTIGLMVLFMLSLILWAYIPPYFNSTEKLLFLFIPFGILAAMFYTVSKDNS